MSWRFEIHVEAAEDRETCTHFVFLRLPLQYTRSESGPSERMDLSGSSEYMKTSRPPLPSEGATKVPSLTFLHTRSSFDLSAYIPLSFTRSTSTRSIIPLTLASFSRISTHTPTSPRNIIMKTVASLLVVGAAIVSATDSVSSIASQMVGIQCHEPNGNYCAGDSLKANIIVTCVNSVPTPSNCNDNLASLDPKGVKTSATCYQSSLTAGDAACAFNGKAYPAGKAEFDIPTSSSSSYSYGESMTPTSSNGEMSSTKSHTSSGEMATSTSASDEGEENEDSDEPKKKSKTKTHHKSSRTKIVYSTTRVTVTSCAPTVTNCPDHSTVVITSVIPVSTTVCPVTEKTTAAPSTVIVTEPVVRTVTTCPVTQSTIVSSGSTYTQDVTSTRTLTQTTMTTYSSIVTAPAVPASESPMISSPPIYVPAPSSVPAMILSGSIEAAPFMPANTTMTAATGSLAPTTPPTPFTGGASTTRFGGLLAALGLAVAALL